MPLAKTDICNMALGHIGVSKRIGDVDTENSVEAKNCRLYYDHCVALLLEKREWNFAKRRTTLANLGSPPDDWGFRYKYPNFCRLALRIVDTTTRTPLEKQKIPYEVRDYNDGYGKVILTDQDDAELEFNYDVNDTNLFSSTFAEAISQVLADKLASPLRVSSDLKREARTMAQFWTAEAGALDSNERQDDQEPDSEFEQAR
jgi:hypothetical protein